MSTAPKVRLISFDLCPYVERSRVVLEEKGVDYSIEFIDLKNRPDWFLEISPRGKVPTLLLDDEPFFESSVINELLDEVFPQPPMLPDTARARAVDRAWIAFCNDTMPLGGRIWFSENPERRAEALGALEEQLVILEKRLSQRASGPYFSGEAFGLVDATFAPLLTRWGVIEARRLEDPAPKFPLFAAYKEAVLGRASVQAAQAEDLVARTIEYSAQRAK